MAFSIQSDFKNFTKPEDLPELALRLQNAFDQLNDYLTSLVLPRVLLDSSSSPPSDTRSGTPTVRLQSDGTPRLGIIVNGQFKETDLGVFMGSISGTGVPTNTDITDSGFWAYYNNTTTGDWYIAVNQAGVVYFALLDTALPFYTKYAVLKESVASGTQGQTIAATTWTTRNLNTIESNLSSIVVSLSSNNFVLKAGTYLITAQFCTRASGSTKLRLLNVGSSAVLLVGLNTQTGVGVIAGVVSPSSNTTYAFQNYYVTAGDGGTALSAASTNEVYGQVTIIQIA